MSGRAINRVLIVPGGAGGTGGNTGSISAGTTNATLGEVVFSNSNGVTFGLDGQTVTASVAGGAGSVNFSAGTASADLDAVVFSNSNGVSFGLNGSTITATVQTNYLTTAMASNRGSDFVQATAVFNGTNASGTIASNAISVSVGNYITTAMASNRGSDFVQATAVFNGTNASGTIASNAISVSVGNYLTSQSNQAASASNGSFTFQTLGFSNANNVTFGTSAGSIVTASVAAAGGGATLSQFWCPVELPNIVPAVAATVGAGSISVIPIALRQNVIVSAADLSFSFSISTSSNSSHAGVMSLAAALFSNNGSTLSSVASGATHYQWTNTSNDSLASLSGARQLSVPFAATLTPGDYWFAIWARSSSTNANWWSHTLSVVSMNNAAVNQGRFMAATAASAAAIPAWGVFTATSSEMFASVAMTDISGSSVQAKRFPYVYFYNSTL